MALKITIVICATILLLFLTVLAIFVASKAFLDAQNREGVEEAQKLKDKLVKANERILLLEEELSSREETLLQMRRRNNDFDLYPHKSE